MTLNCMVNQLHITLEIIQQVLHGDLEKRKIYTKLHTPCSLTCKQQEHGHKCARFTVGRGH